MDKLLLQDSIEKFKLDLFSSIRSASYGGKTYTNGQKAKEALIRSQSLINYIHEAVKASFFTKLKEDTAFSWTVHPPINKTKPELDIYGKIKKKKQDVVFLRTPERSFQFLDGPNVGQIDRVGVEATKRSIIIGIRSQMSSVDKNFDTLMERAFAETLNMRLRFPVITMGEVYLLPIEELDDEAMKKNKITFTKRVKIEKFIRTFNSFSGRSSLDLEEQYKYDASALILVDFKQDPPKIIYNKIDLKQYGFSEEVCSMFEKISAHGFDERLLENYRSFQSEEGLLDKE
tara:strand:+ start:2130 stop:2993 length:864 start_codon:yes stop_codon:yes gene_type:complete